MAAHTVKQAGAPITIDTGSSDTGYLFDAAIPVDRGFRQARSARLACPGETDIRRHRVLKVALRGP